ncbi:MAG: transcriptional regulator GlxA family with amidase domain [Reinekea sp.]
MATHLHYLLIPRFNMFSLSNVMEPTRIANYLSADDIYAHSFISFDGVDITASNGMTVACEAAPEKVERDDFVFVIGSWGAEHYANKPLFSWLRLQSRNGVRLCAVEMGAYILARAGLLAERMATTHWSYLAGFQEQFPDAQTSEQLYTEHRGILCSAGSTAGLDLMLHLIEEAHGSTLSAEISDNMLHHPVRAGKDPQRKTLGRGTEALKPEVREAISLIERNISEPLLVPEIAIEIGLSQRQLERLFRKSVGCSIVQFGLLLRLQHSRVLLISTDLGVREIATASGFNSLSHFAFAFKKCFGRRPSEYRSAWPQQDTAPHWPGTLGRFLDTLKLKNSTD